MTNKNFAHLGSVVATMIALSGLMSEPLIASNLNAASALRITDGSYPPNPCGAGPRELVDSDQAAQGLARRGPLAGSRSAHSLSPTDDGFLVYDSNQGVCWLMDANLAGNPVIREILGVTGINPDGTMDYPTAVNWVNALNQFEGGRGFLGHNNWQLPDNPLDDSSCSSYNNGSFGVACTDSALGNLYSIGLQFTYPQSVGPLVRNTVWPLLNLQPSLYWDADQAENGNTNGESTFSFNTGANGANTTLFNYFHVLPMVRSAIGEAPIGEGLLPYTSGPAAGKAVYDANTDISWTLDANLAAFNNFGVTGSTTVSSKHADLSVPLIDADGAMLFEAIDAPDGWLAGMNANSYAGSSQWKLPKLADLQALYQNLNIAVGDVRLEVLGFVPPFVGLQPGFYWACQRADDPDTSHPSARFNQLPCDPNLPPPYISPAGTPYQYSFNFSTGFEGTDLQTKQFYVMVYFRAPSSPGSQAD